MIRVVLADDHSILRSGLEKLISEEIDIEVVGTAANSNELYKFLDKNKCDIILLDITMPGKTGLEILEDIQRIYPQIKVIMLSMHPPERFAILCLKIGAFGYMTKDSDAIEIVNAIRTVFAGNKYLPTDVANDLIFGQDVDNKSAVDKLSKREMQIFLKLSSGLTVTEAARELSISNSTINTHRSRIFQKLNLKSNVDLIHFALKNKIIE